MPRCSDAVEGAFGPWEELAAAAPPAAPGVFQVRLRRGLHSYPRGRSAMLYYGRDRDLARGVTAFRERVLPGLPWPAAELRVRWRQAAEPERLLGELLARFGARFGSLPEVNRRAAAC